MERIVVKLRNRFIPVLCFAFLACNLMIVTPARSAQQQTSTVLTRAELMRVVPAGFYFEGQSAPTQMRNAAGARVGNKQHIIAALVDTSGYSSEIRAKYEGFLIADMPINVGGESLSVGAYGFGFTDDGKMNVFDIGGNQVLSANTNTDRALLRPRPLMMMKSRNELRLYSGRQFVVIAAR